MILVDTSVWINHFRHEDTTLVRLLEDSSVLSHPLVAGELAMGGLSQRELILEAVLSLPQAVSASDAEVMHFVAREHLFGQGLGFIDAHLLAATRLTPDAALWTKDRRLATAARRLDLASDLHS